MKPIHTLLVSLGPIKAIRKRGCGPFSPSSLRQEERLLWPETLLVDGAFFLFATQNPTVCKPGVEIPFTLPETAKQRGEQVKRALGRGAKGVELSHGASFTHLAPVQQICTWSLLCASELSLALSVLDQHVLREASFIPYLLTKHQPCRTLCQAPGVSANRRTQPLASWS